MESGKQKVCCGKGKYEPLVYPDPNFSSVKMVKNLETKPSTNFTQFNIAETYKTFFSFLLLSVSLKTFFSFGKQGLKVNCSDHSASLFRGRCYKYFNAVNYLRNPKICKHYCTHISVHHFQNLFADFVLPISYSGKLFITFADDVFNETLFPQTLCLNLRQMLYTIYKCNLPA